MYAPSSTTTTTTTWMTTRITSSVVSSVQRRVQLSPHNPPVGRRRRPRRAAAVAAATNNNNNNECVKTKREMLTLTAAMSFLTFQREQARADDEVVVVEEEEVATAEKEEEPVIVMRDIRTVVITGCNHGIGLDAATKFAKTNDLQVILACRTMAKAKEAKYEILDAIAAEGGRVNDPSLLVPAECDLADLESIKTFATSLGDEPIDILCLNAGVQYAGSKEVNRTKDGFEVPGHRQDA